WGTTLIPTKRIKPSTTNCRAAANTASKRALQPDQATDPSSPLLSFFILVAIFGRTQPGCVLEETSERSLVFETQHQGDLFRTFGRIEQQTLGFSLDTIMDNTNGGRLLIGGKDICQCLRGFVQHVCIFLHLFFLLKISIDQEDRKSVV